MKGVAFAEAVSKHLERHGEYLEINCDLIVRGVGVVILGA